MDNTLAKRAGHLTLRLGLGGLALLFLHAPSAKAQECCPDQFTEAGLAKVEGSARKPVKPAANNEKHAKPALVAKFGPIVAPGTKASRKEKSNRPARMVTLKQPVKSLEKKE